jgi:hypothetical protein
MSDPSAPGTFPRGHHRLPGSRAESTVGSRDAHSWGRRDPGPA